MQEDETTDKNQGVLFTAQNIYLMDIRYTCFFYKKHFLFFCDIQDFILFGIVVLCASSIYKFLEYRGFQDSGKPGKSIMHLGLSILGPKKV